MYCPECGKEIPDESRECPKCGALILAGDLDSEPRASDTVKCPDCQVDMKELEGVKFRVGGTSGAWKLLFGEWAELGEGLLSLDLWVCPNCKQVKLFKE